MARKSKQEQEREAQEIKVEAFKVKLTELAEELGEHQVGSLNERVSRSIISALLDRMPNKAGAMVEFITVWEDQHDATTLKVRFKQPGRIHSHYIDDYMAVLEFFSVEQFKKWLAAEWPRVKEIGQLKDKVRALEEQLSEERHNNFRLGIMMRRGF